jgi:SAM-dependent methyltransferase
MLNKRYQYDGKSIIPLKMEQRKAKQKIIDKLLKGEYLRSHRNCVCGSENFEKLSEKDAYGLPCAVVICSQCGLVQVNSCLNEKDLNDFYNDYYGGLYGGKLDYGSVFDEMALRGKAIFEYLSSKNIFLNISQCSVLEIGCNVGGVLSAFKSADCSVYGVDLEQGAVDFAIFKGIPVAYGSAKDVDASNKFDIIILSHVVEHFLDIRSELSVINNFLKDDGVLYIEVPGIYSSLGNVQFDFLDFIEFDHLYYFSLNTLSNAMRLNGFSMVAGDEIPGACIRSVFKKNIAWNAGNEKIENHYYETITRLHYLEKQFQKRKFRHYLYRILKSMPMSLKLRIKSMIKTR